MQTSEDEPSSHLISGAFVSISEISTVNIVFLSLVALSITLYICFVAISTIKQRSAISVDDLDKLLEQYPELNQKISSSFKVMTYADLGKMVAEAEQMRQAKKKPNL